MSFLRIKRYLRSLPDRMAGVHVPDLEDFTRLHSSAKTVSDEAVKALRDKPVRKPSKPLIESQPDSFKKPGDVPEDLPIG